MTIAPAASQVVTLSVVPSGAYYCDFEIWASSGYNSSSLGALFDTDVAPIVTYASNASILWESVGPTLTYDIIDNFAPNATWAIFINGTYYNDTSDGTWTPSPWGATIEVNLYEFILRGYASLGTHEFTVHVSDGHAGTRARPRSQRGSPSVTKTRTRPRNPTRTRSWNGLRRITYLGG